MKRFRFTLEPVMTLRSWEEERARTAYGQAMQQERKFIEQLRTIEQRVEQAATTLRAAETQPIPAGDRAARWRHFLALDRERSDTAQKLITARRIREQKMKLLLDAHRRVRTLDSLKSHQKQAHLAAVRRREELELDEIVSARFQPDL